MIEMLRCRGIAGVHEQQLLSMVPPYQEQVQEIAVQNATAGFYALQFDTMGPGQVGGSQTSARIAWNDSPLSALSQLSTFNPSTEVIQVRARVIHPRRGTVGSAYRVRNPGRVRRPPCHKCEDEAPKFGPKGLPQTCFEIS
jgi:hypothetical protein